MRSELPRRKLGRAIELGWKSAQQVDETRMTDASRRPTRIRFSISTLVLASTIVALSVTVATLYRELGPLRKEVAMLRNEVGQLHVENPTKLHAIRIDTDNELEWKWRIWIPEGTSYRLRAHGGPVPKQAFPRDGGTMFLREPGEHVIRYRIRRDPRDGRWNGSLHTDSGSVGKDRQRWVEWRSRSSTGGGIGTSTRSFDTDQQVEIIRHRVSQANRSDEIEEHAEGFVIWLEPS